MNANLQQKIAILGFWNVFGGWRAKAIYPHFTREFKLAELKKIAALRIKYYKQDSPEKRRSKFNETKRTLCRQPIGSPCFVCGCPGFNRHHLIQLQHGGINSRRNLVILCDPCHAEVHPWLK